MLKNLLINEFHFKRFLKFKASYLRAGFTNNPPKRKNNSNEPAIPGPDSFSFLPPVLPPYFSCILKLQESLSIYLMLTCPELLSLQPFKPSAQFLFDLCNIFLEHSRTFDQNIIAIKMRNRLVELVKYFAGEKGFRELVALIEKEIEEKL